MLTDMIHYEYIEYDKISGKWMPLLTHCAPYMRQWTRSTLVEIIACRLISTKPLPKPMLTFCQLHPGTSFSEIVI